MAHGTMSMLQACDMHSHVSMRNQEHMPTMQAGISLLLMQEKDPLAAGLALSLYRHHVRQVLAAQHGYECQEAEGEFMLAFATPLTAVQFCLQVTMCFSIVCAQVPLV